MNVCHLPFGRTWKYDLKENHDAVRNTYSITKGSKFIEFPPLKKDI